METYKDPQSPGRDPHLWSIAKRRAGFKSHLGTYFVIIAFLWIVWLLTGSNAATSNSNYPWPVWPTAGWGIGLLFHYLGAYGQYKENSAEKEYQKLVRNNP